MKKFALLCAAALICVSACKPKFKSDPVAEAAGLAAAEAWLPLVDGAKYGESWDESAAFFKKARRGRAAFMAFGT